MEITNLNSKTKINDMKKLLITSMLLMSVSVLADDKRYFSISIFADNGSSRSNVTIGRHFPQYPSMILLKAHGACLFNTGKHHLFHYNISEVQVIVTEMKLQDYRNYFLETEYADDTAFSHCDKTVFKVYGY